MFLLLLTLSNVGFLLCLRRPCVFLSRCMHARVPFSQSRRARGNFQDLGFYLSKLDLIQNFTDEADQLIRGDAPWRGPREKHQSFYQMLIETFTKEVDIVMDWQANTGNSCFSIIAIQS